MWSSPLRLLPLRPWVGHHRRWRKTQIDTWKIRLFQEVCHWAVHFWFRFHLLYLIVFAVSCVTVCCGSRWLSSRVPPGYVCGQWCVGLTALTTYVVSPNVVRVGYEVVRWTVAAAEPEGPIGWSPHILRVLIQVPMSLSSPSFVTFPIDDTNCFVVHLTDPDEVD